jgi:hypothetical protein
MVNAGCAGSFRSAAFPSSAQFEQPHRTVSSGSHEIELLFHRPPAGADPIGLVTPQNVTAARSVRGPAQRKGVRAAYLALLTWAFTLFSSLRVVSYLPTMWAIQASGDSSQHSLWTWLTWLGANLTMAAWLYEHNGQRLDRAAIVNLVNATMCAGTIVLIVAHRI